MPTIKITITAEQLDRLHANGEIVISFPSQELSVSETCQGSTVSQQTLSIESTKESATSFFEYGQLWVNKLKTTGNLRTAETYHSALNHLKRFRDGADVLINDVTSALMEQFQCYLRSRQLTMNSVSFNMRILRSIYHKSVREGLVVDCHPFRSVYTGTPTTRKRALSADMLRRLKLLEPKTTQMEFARDMFLLSFYLRGMSFVDMAYIKKSDIQDNQLNYKRHKTGQMLTIKWEQQMQEIVEKYPNTKTPYLLPFILKQNGKERNQYRNHQAHINKELKEIARLAGIGMKLTMYCARHTWATIARDMQIPMNVISRAMGHTNERTTEIYIRTVDTNKVDKANEQIIRMI